MQPWRAKTQVPPRSPPARPPTTSDATVWPPLTRHLTSVLDQRAASTPRPCSPHSALALRRPHARESANCAGHSESSAGAGRKGQENLNETHLRRCRLLAARLLLSQSTTSRQSPVGMCPRFEASRRTPA